MRLLLDTHALIWHFEGSPSLSQSARSAIDNQGNQLFISAASIWELSIKVSIKKITLLCPIAELVSGYVGTGATLLAIAPEHAVAIETLPYHHRDPFDRMLIVQAQLEQLSLVTQDESIASYDVPQIW